LRYQVQEQLARLGRMPIQLREKRIARASVRSRFEAEAAGQFFDILRC
jgi:hypothetical protein